MPAGLTEAASSATITSTTAGSITLGLDINANFSRLKTLIEATAVGGEILIPSSSGVIPFLVMFDRINVPQDVHVNLPGMIAKPDAPGAANREFVFNNGGQISSMGFDRCGIEWDPNTDGTGLMAPSILCTGGTLTLSVSR